MKKQTHLSAGFTLVEVALVVLIGGLLMGTAATMLNNYLQSARVTTTKQRMQDIQNAIIQYQNVNGVLPCVANLNDAQDSITFGQSITASSVAGTDCYATAEATGPATYKTTGGLNNATMPAVAGGIVEGAVPVRTLGLPDQEMVDGWGSRFVYAVTDELTYISSSGVSQYDQTQGSIYVVDSSSPPNNVAKPNGSAQYVIVSLGADRAGGYTIAGNKGVACPAGTTETPNCTYPAPQSSAPTGFVSTLLNSNQTGATVYDDFVTYQTMMNSTGAVPTGMIAPFASATLGTCPAGWISVGAVSVGAVSLCTPSTTTPYYSCCKKQ